MSPNHVVPPHGFGGTGPGPSAAAPAADAPSASAAAAAPTAAPGGGWTLKGGGKHEGQSKGKDKGKCKGKNKGDYQGTANDGRGNPNVGKGKGKPNDGTGADGGVASPPPGGGGSAGQRAHLRDAPAPHARSAWSVRPEHAGAFVKLGAWVLGHLGSGQLGACKSWALG